MFQSINILTTALSERKIPTYAQEDMPIEIEKTNNQVSISVSSYASQKAVDHKKAINMTQCLYQIGAGWINTGHAYNYSATKRSSSTQSTSENDQFETLENDQSTSENDQFETLENDQSTSENDQFETIFNQLASYKYSIGSKDPTSVFNTLFSIYNDFKNPNIQAAYVILVALDHIDQCGALDSLNQLLNGNKYTTICDNTKINLPNGAQFPNDHIIKNLTTLHVKKGGLVGTIPTDLREELVQLFDHTVDGCEINELIEKIDQGRDSNQKPPNKERLEQLHESFQKRAKDPKTGEFRNARDKQKNQCFEEKLSQDIITDNDINQVTDQHTGRHTFGLFTCFGFFQKTTSRKEYEQMPNDTPTSHPKI